MKRFFAAFLAVLLLLPVAVMPVHAEEEDVSMDQIVVANLTSQFVPGNGNVQLKLKEGFDFIDQVYTTPDWDLALAGITLSSQVYQETEIGNEENGSILGTKAEKILLDLGYEKTKYFVYPSNHADDSFEHPTSCCGYKQYKEKDGNIKNVFAIVVRGTNGLSDLRTDIIDGGLRYFENSTSNVWEDFVQFAEWATGKTMVQLKNEDNYFFLTGHSLGGAIANRLSADDRILEMTGNNKNKIYTYTYEAPHTYQYTIWAKSKSISNAFNFKDIDDFVTHITPWPNSATYGTDIVFSVNKLNDGLFRSVFPDAPGGGVSEAPKIDYYGDPPFGHHDLGLPLICILQEGIVQKHWDSVEDVVVSPFLTYYDKNTMEYARMAARDGEHTYIKGLNGKLLIKNKDGGVEPGALYEDEFFTICGIDKSFLYLLKATNQNDIYDIVRINKTTGKSKRIISNITWCLHMDERYFYYVPSINKNCIMRYDRAIGASREFCSFLQPVELMVAQDNGFMVVTRQKSRFIGFGSDTNYFYLIDKEGNMVKNYGSEITVDAYPKEYVEDGGYTALIRYASNGYLRTSAAEVYLLYGESHIKAEGISGWNTSRQGIITTLGNTNTNENEAPYEIVLYDAATGTKKRMTESYSDQAFFTMCQEKSGKWWYFDENDGKLTLYSLSSDFQTKTAYERPNVEKRGCSLSTCNMEILDNTIYFYSMPNSVTANAIDRFDVILEE